MRKYKVKDWTLVSVVIVGSILFTSTAYSQETGQKIFTQRCAACHSIGKGRLVGPDLAGVDQRRSEEWIINFVKSSQSLVNKGDKQAVKIFEEYGKMVMPDQALSNDQIKSVIGYIKKSSAGGSKAEAKPVDQKPTPKSISRGRGTW